MKIRPRNIPIFQYGGGVPQWYIDRYGNRTKLLGWDLNQRYNYANKNLNTNDHRNAGNLDTVYRKNLAYTRTPGAISSDIQTFYNSDGQGMSAEDFVNFYNKNAQTIRNHWDTDLTYNTRTARDHNRLFKRMFASRSDLGMNPGSDYNIGYLNDLEDIEGSSTWLRRMDLYENEFNPNNPDSNRIHEITLSNGLKARVYKKANGDIALLNSPNLNEVAVTKKKKSFDVETGHKDTYGFDWNKIKEVGSKIFGNPDLYVFGRLAGNLINNERVYDELLKGIKPTLRLTYNTYRQIVGDEATKLAYYRRAAQGLTRAARPFTSDADKQMAYQFEAKRIGDELRAQGDLADNLEIRRTSDESNQHLWANTQRATEVANTNIASMNQANALKHNLLAQKHSAQWSSIDNFLLGIEYKKRQQSEKEKAIQDQIWMLTELNNLENNADYLALLKAANDAWNLAVKDGKTPQNEENVKKALQNLKNWKTQYLILMLLSRPIYAKSGTKVIYKKKDDLLYKSTRDVVEHFRKISKMSSDALNRKQPKIEKLTSHPKGKTKKYLLGGVAPFTIYKPVALGGETTTNFSASTSSTKKGSDKDETIDMIKELFKQVAGKGLPSDVNSLYMSMLNFLSRAKAFGEEMSTDDIASMYLSNMQKLNQILYLKANYDNAEKAAIANDAINEFAVDFAGRLVGQNEEGKIVYVSSISDAKEKGINPLTNGQLLQLRATDTSLAGRQELDTIVANGVGISKIAEFLKSLLPKLGTTISDNSIEGYTKKDSLDIIQGLLLLKDAPKGDYKYTKQILTENLLKQANKAILYLAGILPNNMKTVLNTRAELGGQSISDIIGSLIASGMDEKVKLSLEFDAVTGKAAKDANGNSKVGGDDGLKLDAPTALISGRGYLDNIEFNPGTSYAVTVNARHSGFQKKSGENMGSGITMQDATTSTLDQVLDWNKATLGGSRLNPTGYNRIMINNNDVVGVDLPVGLDRTKPDFTMLLKLQLLDLELLKRGIEDTSNNWLQVNLICLEIGLPSKYKSDGHLNDYSWNRFAAFQVTADDSVLVNKDAILDDILGIVEDDNVRSLYEQIILKDNENYKLGSGFLGFGKQALYQGTVFVPIKSNYIAAALSGGLNITISQATDLELRERGYDLSKAATYKPGMNFNEL